MENTSPQKSEKVIKKSPREELQDQIVEFLQSDPRFNAPYGILTGMRPYGRGKIREVTFGIAAYLDATIEIIQTDDIHVKGRGRLAYKYCGRFKSFEELKQKFSLTS